MNILPRQIISFTVILAVLVLALSSFSFLALAQEPTAFEISVIPQADYAIVGQPFTYTVVITNVSQTALSDVIVRTKTPEGTTLIDTFFFNPNWFVGGVQRGEAGEVIWLTQEPVAQGEVLTFGLIVNVPPEIGRELIAEEYSVVTSENLDTPASGPMIRTQLLASVPAATSLPLPKATPTNSPTSTDSPSPTRTSTSTAQVGSNAATEVPTATAVAQVEGPRSASTSTSPSVTTVEDSVLNPASQFLVIIFIIIGLIVLAIAVFGLTRLLSRK